MKISRYFGSIFSIGGICYVLYSLWKFPASLYEAASQSSFFVAVSLAALAIFCSLLLASINWWLLLNVFVSNTELRLSAGVFLVTQLAKYLPGNVGHLIGRGAMLKSYRIQVAASSKAMAVEMLALLIVGGMMSLAFVSNWLFAALQEIPTWILVSFALLSCLFLLILTTSTPARLFAASAWRDLALSRRSIAVVLMINTANFSLNGLALWAVVSLLFPSQELSYWSCLGAASASFLAGYITPGAPGGIGVREAVTTLLLAPTFSTDQAAIAALVVRLGAILSDILGFLIGSACLSTKNSTFFR